MILAILLTIYVVLGLIFILALAVAARRPAPKLESDREPFSFAIPPKLRSAQTDLKLPVRGRENAPAKVGKWAWN